MVSNLGTQTWVIIDFFFHTLNHISKQCFIPSISPACMQISESNHIIDCFSCWASLNMDYLQTLKYAGQPTTGIRLWPWPTYDELFSLSQVSVYWEKSCASQKFCTAPRSINFLVSYPSFPSPAAVTLHFPVCHFVQDIISSIGKSKMSSEGKQPVKYECQL